ncbi:MAG TPA: hypothetical protein VIX87_13655 [Steroidobacteraceae bacterium]
MGNTADQPHRPGGARGRGIDHFLGQVDAEHPAWLPHRAGGLDGDQAGAAGHIEDTL